MRTNIAAMACWILAAISICGLACADETPATACDRVGISAGASHRRERSRSTFIFPMPTTVIIAAHGSTGQASCRASGAIITLILARFASRIIPRDTMTSSAPPRGNSAWKRLLGYDEAGGGKTFVKIGVGVLERPADEKKYAFWNAYKIVRPGTWTVTVGVDWIQFEQSLAERGWGYSYSKRISISPDKPEFVIEHTRFEEHGQECDRHGCLLP